MCMPSHTICHTSTTNVALVVILDLKNKCSFICVVHWCQISSHEKLEYGNLKENSTKEYLVFGYRFDSITWRVNGKQCHLSFITQTYEMTYNKYLGAVQVRFFHSVGTKKSQTSCQCLLNKSKNHKFVRFPAKQ